MQFMCGLMGLLLLLLLLQLLLRLLLLMGNHQQHVHLHHGQRDRASFLVYHAVHLAFVWFFGHHDTSRAVGQPPPPFTWPSLAFMQIQC